MPKKLAIVGHSRAGKDTAAQYLAERTNLIYMGSLSGIVLPMIAKELNISTDEAWKTRHDRWQFWQKWCDNYRRYDKLKLISLAVKQADIITGIRDIHELNQAKYYGLIDLVVWINNPNIVEDPTMTFDCKVADIMILNEGSIYDFQKRLAAFANFAGLLL